MLSRTSQNSTDPSTLFPKLTLSSCQRKKLRTGQWHYRISSPPPPSPSLHAASRIIKGRDLTVLNGQSNNYNATEIWSWWLKQKCLSWQVFGLVTGVFSPSSGDFPVLRHETIGNPHWCYSQKMTLYSPENWLRQCKKSSSGTFCQVKWWILSLCSIPKAQRRN